MRGALTLTTGFTQAVLNDDPSAALDEAAELADHEPDGNQHHLLFTPANVVLWRMSAALERGEHPAAATLADTITPEQLTVPSRRTTLLIEQARALYGLRKPDEQVMSLLVEAEKLGPIRLRSNAFVRDIVASMLTSTRRTTPARDARGLASRMGLLKA